MRQNKQLNAMKRTVLGGNARARKGDWDFMGIGGAVKRKVSSERKKANVRLIHDTQRREARYEREAVVEKWKDRNYAIKEKERGVKERAAARKKAEFNRKYGGTIKATKSIGKGLGKLGKGLYKLSKKKYKR